MTRGLGKKPPAMASRAFDRLFSQCSKAALIDVLWCACQLGTDETADQIATQAARNAVIALDARRDAIPREIADVAKQRIDADTED